MFKDAVSLQGKRCSPMRTVILLPLALLTMNGPATAQAACPPPIEMPSDVDYEEVHNLWEDIHVLEAQAVLCSTHPGQGQVLGIIDWNFGDVTTPGDHHGSYTSQIAAGPPDGTGHGYGGDGLYPVVKLPGIAAGAVRVEESFQGWWDGFHQRCVDRTPDRLDWLCEIRTRRKFVDLMTEAFSHAADQTGPEAAIGFTMTTLLDPPLELLVRPTRRQVRSMLDVFRSYTEHGIVVLPANFFHPEVANRRATRSRVASSRALVVHQIHRDRMQYDGDCEIPNTPCQPATMPYAIDLVVETTNGNNSIVVPAVLGTIALMKNANPLLTNAEIMAILTDPDNSCRTVTVEGRPVPVLDALEAVNRARSFPAASPCTVTIKGSDAIFLAGRTDLVIPPASGPWPDGLLRHGSPTPEEIQETVPPFISVSGGDVIRVADPAVGEVSFFNGFGGIVFGPSGNGLSGSNLSSFGGISGYIGPQGALVGVFLDDSIPVGVPPPTLDFSPAGLRIDLPTLSPDLGQVFYIGDGTTSGGAVQEFIAPPGATRLFLGIPDGFGFTGVPGAYDDNDGSYQIRIERSR